MNKILFLDLEETLIKSWDNPVFCNTDLSKGIIEKEQTNQVHLFSFAISDSSEKEIFSIEFKLRIEEHFGIRIITWMSVEGITVQMFKSTGVLFDKTGFTTMRGKLKAYHDFCISNFTCTECVLVDDTVPNSIFQLIDKNLIIHTVHIP